LSASVVGQELSASAISRCRSIKGWLAGSGCEAASWVVTSWNASKTARDTMIIRLRRIARTRNVITVSSIVTEAANVRGAELACRYVSGVRV
jgi:hypothetical protein